MGTAPRKLYNPIKDNKTIMGTLYWCSLNSHSGYGEHDVGRVITINGANRTETLR
jgi:hypothetical protein